MDLPEWRYDESYQSGVLDMLFVVNVETLTDYVDRNPDAEMYFDESKEPVPPGFQTTPPAEQLPPGFATDEAPPQLPLGFTQ